MKIGIVGAGQVGAACAYSCVLRGVGTQIVLVDRNPDLARAQAEDILHATPFSEAIPVASGDFAGLEGAGIVMVAAGVPQKDASESRLELLKRNADVFEAIVPQILAAAPNAILLIASNPVDIMADVALSIGMRSGLDASRVIGSGTILDTARFRALLAGRLGVSSHSVHAYVLGEHGDSEVLHWSGVTLGAIPLDRLADSDPSMALTAEDRAGIDEAVRRAAYRIIAGKGATWFGIGTGMARIAEAIIGDERAILTCSARTPSVAGVSDVTLSLPRVIGAGGMKRVLMPALNDGEAAALARSASIIAEASAAVSGR